MDFHKCSTHYRVCNRSPDSLISCRILDLIAVLSRSSFRLSLIVTFGYFESENDNDEYIPMNTIPLNTLLLLGKQYIFQQKLKDCTLSLVRFKFYVSTNVREEHSLLHLFAGTL